MKGDRGRSYQELVRRVEESVINKTDADGESWSLLANAIIVRAIDDYKEGRISYLDLYRFVHSDWFLLLSRGCVSPNSILKEVTKNGKKKDSRH